MITADDQVFPLICLKSSENAFCLLALAQARSRARLRPATAPAG